MIVARQSTARTITIGPVLDASGVAVTDSVVGDFKISKNGGAPGALNGSATLTHRHTGNYSLALTASDLDTVGQAEITCDDTTNACAIKDITVIEEAVYDELFASSALGYIANAPVNVAQIEGSDPTDQIRDAAAAALVVHRLDELLNADSDIDGAAPPTVGSVFYELMSKTTGSFTYDQTTDSLEAVRDRGDAAWGTAIVPTAADNADAVWDEAYGDHQTNGTFGKIVTQTWSSIYAGGGTVDSTGATSSSFRTDIVADDDFYNDMLLTFTSGALAGQTRPISDFTSTNGVFTFDEAFAAAPANGVTFQVVKTHVHPISQIQSGLATSTELAKVPKSDGTVTWNATALASINAEADTALSDYGALKPTTAGRTLDVTATGAAGVDWSNIENPTTTVDLSGTTISTSQAVASVSGAVGSVTGAVGSVTGNVGGNVAGSVGSVTGNVGGNVTGSIGSLATQAKADVNAEADAALVDINLDHLVKSAVDTNFATTVHLDSVIGQLADNGTTATFDRTTDSQEAIRDRGDSAWTTATGFSTLDAAGVRTAVGLASANLDTQFSNLDGKVSIIQAVAEQLDDTLVDQGGGVYGFTTAALQAGDDATLAAIAALNNLSAAQVWSAATRTLTALDEDSTTLDLDATIRGAVGMASANLDTQLSTIDTVVGSILADTGTDGVVLSTTTLQSIADTLLARNVSNVEGSAPEHSLTTLVLAMLESSRSGTTWTIKRTDGSTTHATKTLTVDADADPITGVT